ncbi:MAG: hypothetical protein ACXWEQ_05120 [Halobacteriota archaeon]
MALTDRPDSEVLLKWRLTEPSDYDSSGSISVDEREFYVIHRDLRGIVVPVISF